MSFLAKYNMTVTEMHQNKSNLYFIAVNGFDAVVFGRMDKTAALEKRYRRVTTLQGAINASLCVEAITFICG